MIEGAILYSNFAFLKHFQTEGKNKLVNVTAGINFSVRDENIHAQAGAWLFRTLLAESNLSEDKKKQLIAYVIRVAEEILQHEKLIIKKIFEKGLIRGITDVQLENFVMSRLDLCVENLGHDKIYKPTYNPIAGWFYKNINSGKLHDFFFKQGSDYSRAWCKTRFKWGQIE
jgi:ribonucleotide reductase beta subunit family protein with ferritin-like domain